jgi:cell division protein FtsB
MNALWKFLWWLLPLTLLLTTAVYVPLKLRDGNGFSRVRRISSQLEILEAKNRQLQAENETLRRQIRAIRNDPDYIENLARNDLGLIGPDEVVFQF